MNLLYCGDTNIAQGLALSVLSVNNHVSEPLHIYVLTMSLEWNGKIYHPIDQETIERIRSVIQKQNPESTIQVIDLGWLFQKELPTTNLSTRFTPYCMLRLFADEIDLPDKILYLDTDVLCRKDPMPFYEQDLEGIELAGVLDHYGQWFFHQKPFRFDYMNSGVLLLNLKEIKKTGLFKNARKMCIEKQMFMPDQSAINKLVQSKRLWPRKYNEQRRLYEDTIFQHFTTSFRFFPLFHLVSVKPWDRKGVHETLGLSEYDSLYSEYDKMMA